jgi:hypothetical protein
MTGSAAVERLQHAHWLAGGWRALGSAVRRLSRRTGVTDAEAYGTLPGDDVIPHPMAEWTRGVTVHAAPERIWPWLVQMGYGRAGWYTPAWVDRVLDRLARGRQYADTGLGDRCKRRLEFGDGVSETRRTDGHTFPIHLDAARWYGPISARRETRGPLRSVVPDQVSV